jgi:hypothetical protein
MKLYRKALRLGVAVLALALLCLHAWRSSSGGRRGAAPAPLAHGAARAAAAPASAPAPYRPRVHPIVYPSAFGMPRHPDGYDTWLWTDAFLKDDRVYVISMVYVNTPRDHARAVFRAPALPGGSAQLTTVHVRDAYESVVVAWFDAPGLGKLDRLDLEIEYESHKKATTLLRAPGGWESPFAMCALFLQDKHLLRMWTTYWYLLGIDAFYLYWNGDVAAIPELVAAVEDIPATVTFIHWPFDYWVPDSNRPHHGQPQAWNSCYHRNKDRHDFLVFYDLVRARLPPAIVSLRRRPSSPPYRAPRRMSSSRSRTTRTCSHFTARCRGRGRRCARSRRGRR